MKTKVNSFKPYVSRYLSWCTSYDQEVKELRELIDGGPSDEKLLKREYKELTGKRYKKEEIKMGLTLSDIARKVERIKIQIKKLKETSMEELFETYDKVDEITKLLTDLESCQNGEYDFDEDDNGLIYAIKIPVDIVDLPFISDYLTKDYAFIPKYKGYHNEIFIAQSCGQCIAVNFNHDSNCVFIFDRNCHEIILSNYLSWHDDIYISAKIEEYQQEKGEFNDVVIINSYYGSYVKHFESSVEVTEENYKDIIKKYEDKHLNNMSRE